MRFSQLTGLGTALLGASLVGTLLVGTVGAQTSQSVTMRAQNNSGQDGTAMLTEMGNQTRVVLDLRNSPAGPQPAHIHSGRCPEVGPVTDPLTNVMNGRWESTVNARLSDVMTGNFAINVHLSPQQATTYVSCGDIPAASTATGGAAAGGATGTLPRTGGPALPLAGLALAGLISLGVGVYSRRRAA